ncbi:MAG TPA: tyrosine-type recombinase/integrase, partial [Candidatus Binatia bacterium]|nr:tyrosine-type recombinase/integrase [Candidatus Binatia bacterium]
PAADKVPFESLADGLLKDYEVNSKKSLRCVKIKVNKHLLPFFGGKPAHNIKTADVRAFVDKRQAEGASNGEINRELAALKRMFNLALEAELITRKPVIKLLAEDNVRQGFFEPWEFDAVLAKLPDYLRPPITFAYYTGWRVQSEILPLTWDRVDLEAGTVLLYRGTTKNKKGRLIQLPQVLQGILAQQWQDHLAHYPECPWVFPKNGERLLTFYKVWRRACQAAGLSGRLSHDFRRTAVRNLVRAGVPERVAMMVTGHATRDVFERYNIVSPGDLEEAAKRIDERIATRMVTRTVTIGETPGQEESPEAPQVPVLQ